MTRSHHHHYKLDTRWTGNLGPGTSTYNAYSRNYELGAEGKAAAIPGSSDPMFRGDHTRFNPEELLLGALSSCHMLWVLHLCAEAGIVITEYVDEATGDMREHADGSGEFTSVVLHPRMAITDVSRTAEALEIHHRAQHFCCLARSMNFPVTHEAVVTGASPSD